MRILILGNEMNIHDCRTKFGGGHEYHTVTSYHELRQALADVDVVFDFYADPRMVDVAFKDFPNPVFYNSIKRTLRELVGFAGQSCPRFGFNGMAGFICMRVLETSILDGQQMPVLISVAGRLATEFCVVDDRVGMVTPRIVCRIINEAYCAAEEGTATREDIDLAMKLGTNYPYGPFEWCRRIGVGEVYSLLERLGEVTRDDSYEISPLLKRDYLSLTSGEY